MSLIKGITGAVRAVGRRARSAIGLPVSQAGQIAIGTVTGAVGTAVGAVRRNLPGIAGGIAGGAGVGMLFDEAGNPVQLRRRRGRGFSSRDIRQTRRMLRLIGDMQRLVPRPRGGTRGRFAAGNITQVR